MFKFVVFICLIPITFAYEYGNGINDLWTNNIFGYGNELPVVPPVPFPYQDGRIDELVPQSPVAIFPTVPNTVITPKETALVAAATKAGLVSKVVTTVFGFVRAGLYFLINNGLALVVGSISAISICKFTPICSKINSINSFLDFRRELASVASSDRFIRAAEFVEKAIRKYNGMQN